MKIVAEIFGVLEISILYLHYQLTKTKQQLMKIYGINESEHLTTNAQVIEFVEFMAKEYPENLKIQAHDDEDFEWFVSEFLKNK